MNPLNHVQLFVLIKLEHCYNQDGILFKFYISQMCKIIFLFIIILTIGNKKVHYLTRTQRNKTLNCKKTIYIYSILRATYQVIFNKH